MLIGPDSSMVHIAGALGENHDVRVLGIFGPTDPGVRLRYNKAYWMEGFDRCKRQHCWYVPCRGKFCLKTLSPSKVLGRVKGILMEDGLIC
jgi:ADP-heptose:LPS heptosyltransferase